MPLTLPALSRLIAVCLVVVLGQPASGSAQPTRSDPAATTKPPAPDTISGEALLSDLRLLQEAYEALHPGLLRYRSPSAMQAAFRLAGDQVREGLPLGQAILAFAALTAKLQCGHTYPNFFNQQEPVVQRVFTGQNRTPFYFRWLGQRMVVTRDLTGTPQLPVGTEILQVNGVDAKVVFDKLMPYLRADGANDAKRAALLAVTGESRWEAFDLYYPLLFPPAGSTYRLRVQRPGGTRTELSVPAMRVAERDRVRAAAA